MKPSMCKRLQPARTSPRAPSCRRSTTLSCTHRRSALKSGSYGSDQLAILKTSTPDAKIYYTTNGSEPSSSSTVYKGEIAIKNSEILKAMAVKTGYKNSLTAEATYTFGVAAPTFSLKSGTYYGAQSVTLKTATAGAKIYYTTNGYAPTTASAVYSKPLAVKTSETIKAVATLAGMKSSEVVSEAYSLAAATPLFSHDSGTYTSAPSITLKTTTPGAKIHYNHQWDYATASSTVYTTSIVVKTSENPQGDCRGGWFRDECGWLQDLLAGRCRADDERQERHIQIHSSRQHQDHHSRGKDLLHRRRQHPNTASKLYTAPVTVKTSETIKAIAIETGFKASVPAAAKYEL